jgi:hypothetical protein
VSALCLHLFLILLHARIHLLHLRELFLVLLQAVLFRCDETLLDLLGSQLRLFR